MPKLSHDDPRPPFRQVLEGLRTDIDNGTYGPGDKLPSYGAVAEEYGVSVGTVKRAFGDLQSDGLIVIRHGQGSFVRTQPLEAESEADQAEAISDLYAKLADVTRRLEQVERKLRG
ncbi:GntR family transcriptional regulator [Saccharopolyspora shandongensis]|uniref:GntR family transcriptional regulator n=1 Tax=Saccharopolyspora shandongensis TaxID=418495 RepID=A0A1H3FMN8_9PSEU|nr:GntR family transcriptional regulator [Saccharopolyspora shandongensis]SDX91414.1 GntR family transcriptional regulator [Saccharopolyspora shandongensis]